MAEILNAERIASFPGPLSPSGGRLPAALFRIFQLDSKGAKACKSCRSHPELSNEYLLAKLGSDTAENEPEYEYKIIDIRIPYFLSGEEASGGDKRRSLRRPGRASAPASSVLGAFRGKRSRPRGEAGLKKRILLEYRHQNMSKSNIWTKYIQI